MATFENHWNLLLRECPKRREKETQILTTQKTFTKRHFVQQKKHQLRHNINRHNNFCVKRTSMGHFTVENKLQVDKKNKN